MVSAFRTSQDEVYGASVADFSAAAAGHLEGFGCGLGPAGFTTNSRSTISNSGNATLFCKGDTGTRPQPALVLDVDNACGIPLDRPPFFAIGDAHLVWTPSGQATLVCHAKP
jgi:hypothetical protein